MVKHSGLTPSFSVSSLEYILKESQMEIWTETQRQVMADLALSRHRASSHALVIQETYPERNKQLLPKKNAAIVVLVDFPP
jgi:hypothetical protein